MMFIGIGLPLTHRPAVATNGGTAPVVPVIGIASGSGYAGSSYSSTVAGQWYADNTPISGATSARWVMTRAHEGAAIRCGNSAPIRMWMPQNLSNPLKTNGAWLDPKGGRTVVNGKVTKLSDQFGLRDFIQSNATNQPDAEIINGYEAAVWPETTSNCGLSPTAAFAPVWLAAVLRSGDGTTSARANTISLLSAGIARSAISVANGSVELTNNTLAVFDNLQYDGQTGNSSQFLPRPKSLVTMGLTLDTARQWGIGNAVSNNAWSGPVFEWLYLGGVPDVATQQRIQGCLAHRNGIATSLPDNHPYRQLGPRVQ